MNRPPTLLRIAGLPAAAIESFSSPELLTRASRRHGSEERLARLRAAIVDFLYQEIGAGDGEHRNFLVDLKRDGYNGRRVGPRADDPRWHRLPPHVRQRLGDLLRLEREADGEMEDLRRAWDAELRRERIALRSHLENPRLMRGLSLASRPLVERLPMLGEEPAERRDRKLRKLEQSLLRYVARTAVKLSPYSTLTRIGLGEVTPLDGDDRIALAGNGWHETSLLRMRRYVIDQIAMVLAYSQALRGETRIRLNDTLERLETGHHQLLRPELLRHDESAGQLRYVRMSLARLALRGPVVESILAELDGNMEGLTVAEICRRCLLREPPTNGDDEARREQIEARIEALLGAGVLLPVPPWTSDEVHLERAVSAALRRLDEGAVPAALRSDLEALVDGESKFAGAEQRPIERLQEMGSLIHAVWDDTCRLADTQLRLLFPAGEKYNFYEDVFLDTGTDGGEIARLDARMTEELLSIGDVLWRLTDFYHPRRDFLLALDHLIERRWGATHRVPFLHVFQEAQELWKDFVAFKYDARESFDPVGVEAAAELKRHRELLRQELLEVGRDEVLDLERLFAVDRRIPLEHRSSVGSCIFVQPLDRSGERWVLNRLFEGCGRYTSRFTSPMPTALRRRYVAHFLRRCRAAAATGGGEIVDVLYGHENTVNLHYPQTPRALVIPGESTSLPRHRRLYLKDLWVQRSAGGGLPQIVDSRGRSLLPCHFSAVNGMYLPVLVKFLSAFGPSSGAGKAIFPWRTEVRDGITVSAPIVAGPLLLRRRRWIFPASSLPTEGPDSAATFAALHDWRARHGIPVRVFSIEKIDENETGQPVYKPQYIDFSSPLLVELFLSQRRGGDEKVTLEEALPTPDAYPADAAGDRWAVEVVVERLAVSPPWPSHHSDAAWTLAIRRSERLRDPVCLREEPGPLPPQQVSPLHAGRGSSRRGNLPQKG